MATRSDVSSLIANPRRFARIAGIFYLLVFVFGIAALNTSGDTRVAANLMAAAVYYVVTAMLYLLYRPVSRAGSLGTALFSLTALTIGVLSDLGALRSPVNTLVLFGAYCIGLGWLTLKSTFLPKAVGALLVVAGLGWLTYVTRRATRRIGHGAGHDRRGSADHLAADRWRRAGALARAGGPRLNTTELRRLTTVLADGITACVTTGCDPAGGISRRGRQSRTSDDLWRGECRNPGHPVGRPNLARLHHERRYLSRRH